MENARFRDRADAGRFLSAALDLFLVRKLGVPGHEELATGATMRAAVAALRVREPAELVVAVPVAARETTEAPAAETDRVVRPLLPASFQAVGPWRDDFTQTEDDEVRTLLARADAAHPPTDIAMRGGR